MESYCLLILTLCICCILVVCSSVKLFNICCNTVYRTIFNLNHLESATSFTNGLGLLEFFTILKFNSYNQFDQQLKNASNPAEAETAVGWGE